MFLLITLIGIILYLKGNRYYGLLIFLFLLTDGFQFVPEPLMLFGLNLYGKDYALAFSLAILMSYLITGKIRFPYKSGVFLSILVFLIFLFIGSLIDVKYYNPSFSGFLLMFRVNLFFLTYFWLSKIDKKLFERVFRVIFIITIIQSVLCLLQIPTSVRLLTGGGVTEFNDLGFHWIRYTNLPYFLMPCFFIVLMNKDIKVPNRGYIITLFLVTILFTLTRTLILGLVITIGISVVAGMFRTQKKIIFGFAAMFILLLPIIGARLMSSTKDINSAVTADSFEAGSDMTFAYRMFHLTERVVYVAKDLKHEIFGIGFIHERDFPKDTFLLGHKDKDYVTTQLEQDDISWSNLILRYGFLGTALYVIVYLSFCVCFFKRKSIPAGSAAFMVMSISFILTFASGKFSQADFFLVPMFFFFYMRKLDLEDEQREEEDLVLSQEISN